MAFSSVPLYLDPPNWNNQQQQQQHQRQQQLSHHGQLFASGGGGAGVDVHQHHQQHQQHHQQHQQQQHQQQQHVHPQQHQLPPPGALMVPRPPDSMGGGGAVAVNGGGGGGGPTSGGGGAAPRAGSMTDRARMAKIPQPEPGLKCPRCESTNTKFCYFNNYSLTQPRHFCKTCRRYWTRGGALRSVPVGGGCRRNKRTKSSKSSSSSAAASASGGGTSSSTSSTTTPGNGNGGAAAMMAPPQDGQQMPFFASLHPMGGGGGDHYGTGGASRLGFSGLSSLDPVDYQLGGGGGAAAALGMDHQWRMPQFPFFGQQQHQMSAGIYPSFDAAADANGFAVTGQIKQMPGSSAGLITQLSSVKMEDSHHPSNNNAMANNTASAREFLGLPGNLQFWGVAAGNNGAGGGNDNNGASSHSGDAGAPGGSWAVDLSGSGFNSSSSGNIM